MFSAKNSKDLANPSLQGLMKPECKDGQLMLVEPPPPLSFLDHMIGQSCRLTNSTLVCEHALEVSGMKERVSMGTFEVSNPHVLSSGYLSIFGHVAWSNS